MRVTHDEDSQGDGEDVGPSVLLSAVDSAEVQHEGSDHDDNLHPLRAAESGHMKKL